MYRCSGNGALEGSEGYKGYYDRYSLGNSSMFRLFSVGRSDPEGSASCSIPLQILHSHDVGGPAIRLRVGCDHTSLPNRAFGLGNLGIWDLVLDGFGSETGLLWTFSNHLGRIAQQQPRSGGRDGRGEHFVWHYFADYHQSSIAEGNGNYDSTSYVLDLPY